MNNLKIFLAEYVSTIFGEFYGIDEFYFISLLYSKYLATISQLWYNSGTTLYNWLLWNSCNYGINDYLQ